MEIDVTVWSEVLERLARFEDERSILDTLYRYAHAIDARRYDELLDCFTPDGAFVYLQRPDPEPLFQHRGDGLRPFFEERDIGRPLGDTTHANINARVVALNDNDAHVESYFATLRQRADRGGVEIMSTGRYFDELVRCADGVWRIAVRRAERDSPRLDQENETRQ
jgi:3-phenylpropionate/cinnamic acid dioxygenase small subunit